MSYDKKITIKDVLAPKRRALKGISIGLQLHGDILFKSGTECHFIFNDEEVARL